MKQKVKDSLRNLLEEVKDHEAETEFSAVSVDLADLKRLLRWAQNKDCVWFEGDRVERTGRCVKQYPWLDEGMTGTVIRDSDATGRTRVEWDGGPAGFNRVEMFHNEIKLVKHAS